MHIKRNIKPQILQDIGKNKAIIVYGARQVGKTTLLRKILDNKQKTLYLSCDKDRIRRQLKADDLELKSLIGDNKIIVLDEAQYLKNPGHVMKILIDNFPDVTVLATGSSAFSLANKLNEPLTGRHLQYKLFPFSFNEIKKHVEPTDLDFNIDKSLLYGTYPEVFLEKSNEEKTRLLERLTESYLFRDILSFNLVKDSSKIRDLVVLLALQIGNEVSMNELSIKLGIDRKTVENYIDLLEKSFVIFRLRGFDKNIRNAISKKVKIYFYDCGIRNSIINNFNRLNLRNDSGSIFENYVISEMIKKHANDAQRTNFYFWRMYYTGEVDLITEKNGIINAYEIKLQRIRKVTALDEFKKNYPKSKTFVITRENFKTYL